MNKLSKDREKLTLLAVADECDYDSFQKFERERRLLRRFDFDYLSLSFKALLKNKIPPVKTKGVVVFLFFPFDYWNRKIEPKNYKGIYANRSFYEKFVHFFKLVEQSIKRNLSNHRIYFINRPSLCAKYRDKLLVKKLLFAANIAVPQTYKAGRLKSVYGHLNGGNGLFIKVRYGSMGKGFTYLTRHKWQTNFSYKNNRILSRKSDYGWRFKDVTGNSAFLSKLLGKDIYIEEAIDSLIFDSKKFDLRIYVFFQKVIFIYPRSNDLENITTNISQGGKGHRGSFLKSVPPSLIAQAKYKAVKATNALGLNFAGVDMIIDANLKDVYCLDVNVFPGFPRSKIFNLARHLIKELGNLRESNKRYRKH